MIEDKNSYFSGRKIVLGLVLVLIFGIGLAVRLFDLTDLPLDFHPTRQIHSALIARGMYYQSLENIPSWQREMAVRQWKLEGVIEPTLMEWLASQSYRIVGEVVLWMPRLYSIFFWLAGGVGLFLLARSFAGVDAALAVLAFFLVLPYGVFASRSFQPDPLMTALIIWAFWSVDRWQKAPSWRRAILTGALGGLAILIKAVAIFFIGGAFCAVVISVLGWKQVLKNKQVWLIAFLVFIPYGIYHVYGMYVAGFLQGQLSLRFFPEMWRSLSFYLSWSRKINQVVGIPWFVLALMGTLVLPGKSARAILLGAWAGYFLFGMVLAHHTVTHDYYHLLLIPLVALGLSGGAGILFEQISGKERIIKWVTLGVLLFGIGYYTWDARTTLKKTDYRPETAYWQEIGDRLGHNSNVIALSQDYATRLSYWGWVTAANWPTMDDMNFLGFPRDDASITAYFEQNAAGRDYFLVTLPDELEKQQVLEKILASYKTIYEKDSTVIYDLRQPVN